MATAKQLIGVAASQLGYKETPSGSNLTKYGKWYGMDGEPWCDMFVSWVANEVGMLDDIGKFAYCPYHVDYFKKRGRWVKPGGAKPGDICFFTGGGVASHVGIVEWVDGDVIHTIEGNTSVTSNDNGGAVMRRERMETGGFRIMGYGRPDYADEMEDDLIRIDIPSGTYPVYRAYREVSDDHFFTGSESEYLSLPDDYAKEDVGFYGADTGEVVYRLYDPNARQHHYTTDHDEAQSLVNVGWNAETVTFAAAREGKLVYRVYNPNTGAHHFTADIAERDMLVDAGWNDEEIGWYAAG